MSQHDEWPDQTVIKPAPPADPAWETNGQAAVDASGRFMVWMLAGFAAAMIGLFPVTAVAFIGALAIVITGFFRGVSSLGQLIFTSDQPPAGFSVKVLFFTLVNAFLSMFGFLMAAGSTLGFGRGRQLRSFGKVLLPPVEAGPEWTNAEVGAVAAGDERAAVAARWRENGRTEHASVGAFARLTLDLLALGAPPDLIADANRDSLDEIRHTELCFSLAKELDGKEESPGAFPAARTARTSVPTRPLALASLAVDSLVDGALHEGVSARVIARLAKTCTEPKIRAVLREIAADEGRHAAHGWDVVAWCLKEGGAPVASALRGALKAIPATIDSGLPAEAAGGAWERWGIHGEALESEEYAKSRMEVIAHCERLLAQRLAA